MNEGEATLLVMNDAMTKLHDETVVSCGILVAGCQVFRFMEWKEARSLEAVIKRLREMDRDLTELMPAFKGTYPTIKRAHTAIKSTKESLAIHHGLEVPV